MQSDVTAGNPDVPTREGVVRSISGFKPMVTGTLCDVCNAHLAEGDEVFVALDYYGGEWDATRTHCTEHHIDLHDRLTNAVARCELGALIADGMVAPLYNPDVVAFERVDDDGQGAD